MTLPSIGSMLADLAKRGAKRTTVERPMCSGCAFKKGTPANSEVEAAENALEALLSDRMHFGCHQQRDQLCTGYLLAKAVED